MMPAIHTETFKVRHYECDSYGHVNNAVYLRYMQEAGIGAAAAIGQDSEKLKAMNRTWLPRFTEIEYLSPLSAGETVDVKTWVSGFRRVISRRIYEFRRHAEEEIVARAYTDWVFLESDRLQPATIPPEVKSLFVPEGADQSMSPRYRFPQPAPPPEGVFRIVRHIEWQDIDMMQHLNNASYLDYAMDAGVQLTSAFGWPMSYWMEEGIAFVARRNSIEYLIPAYLEDQLEITTWLFNIRPATVTRQFDIRRMGTNELLARIQTLWVMLNLESGRPMRIPDSMIEILAPNISDEK
jgi:acyl-CoA thioester hydrolase